MPTIFNFMLQTTVFTLDNVFIFDNFVLDNFIFGLFKNLFIIGGIFYVIFAIVIIRQIQIMNRTLITTFSPVVRLLGYLHLIFAVGILLFYIFII